MSLLLQLTITGIISGCLYSLVAVSIVLVYKATQVVSLAHGGFMTVAALLLWYCVVSWEVPIFFALPIVFLAAVILGWLVNRFCMRPLIGQSAFSAFFMTFGIFMFIIGIIQMILKGESKGMPSFLPQLSASLGGVHISSVHIFSLAVVILIFSGLSLLFYFTEIGLGMRATSEDHRLSQSTGIDVNHIFSIIWIISSVISAVAGIALSIVMDVQYELPMLGIKGLIVALFGGLESLAGALVAGIVLGLLENMAAGYLDPIVGGGVKDVTAFLVLLIFLWIKPYGLFGQVRIERI